MLQPPPFLRSKSHESDLSPRVTNNTSSTNNETVEEPPEMRRALSGIISTQHMCSFGAVLYRIELI
jgi:hypothetical protein